jgi:hypothetical protein
MARIATKSSSPARQPLVGYDAVLGDIAVLLESARRAVARSVNAAMTVTYWEIGRRIVEFEQAGNKRAEYGSALLIQLSADLTHRFGRGFSRANLEFMRRFYQTWPISQTLSGKLPAGNKRTIEAGVSGLVAVRFPLP